MIPSDLFRSSVGLSPSGGSGPAPARNGLVFVPGQNRSNNLFQIFGTANATTNFCNLITADGAATVAGIQPASGDGIIKAVKLFGYRNTNGAEDFFTAVQAVLVTYRFFKNGRLAVPVANNAIGVNNSDYLILDLEFSKGETVYLEIVNGNAIVIATVIQTYSWYY